MIENNKEKFVMYYELSIWNSDTQTTNVMSGFLYASDYSEGMSILNKYYGEEIDIVLRLEFLDDMNIIELPLNYGHKMKTLILQHYRKEPFDTGFATF